uniref:Uncharacterized protein n=1 Tax=Gopherus evgoodei TaxID=1825980 RepID=A0A8C4Y298_9SAUR
MRTRTVSGAPPGSGASPAPALPLAAMRAPRERRSQSQAKSSPSWKATKRSSAKARVPTTTHPVSRELQNVGHTVCCLHLGQYKRHLAAGNAQDRCS